MLSENFIDTRGEGGKDGVQRMPVETLMSQRTENVRNGNLMCSRNFRVSERFMRTRGEGEGRRGKVGASRVPVRTLLSHNTKKIRKGTLRCFKKFRVSKSFLHKRGLS